MEPILSTPEKVMEQLMDSLERPEDAPELQEEELIEFAKDIEAIPSKKKSSRDSGVFRPKGEGNSGNRPIRQISPPEALNLGPDDDGEEADSTEGNDDSRDIPEPDEDQALESKANVETTLANDFLSLKDWMVSQIRALQNDINSLQKTVELLMSRTSLSVPLSGRLSPTRKLGSANLGSVASTMSPTVPSTINDTIITDIVKSWGPYPSLAVVRRGKIATLAKITHMDLSGLELKPSEWNASSVLLAVKKWADKKEKEDK